MNLLLFALLLMLPMTALAGPVEDAQAMSQFGMTPGQIGNTAVTGDNVPGFVTASPPEANYYGSPASLSNASSTATDPAGAGQMVQDAFATRPQVVINPYTDPLITGSAQIQRDAYAYVGMNTTATDGCQTVTTTTPATYDTYTCNQSRASYPATCKQDLVVTATLTESCIQGEVLLVKAAGTFLHSPGGAVTVSCDMVSGVSVSPIASAYWFSNVYFTYSIAAACDPSMNCTVTATIVDEVGTVSHNTVTVTGYHSYYVYTDTWVNQPCQ